MNHAYFIALFEVIPADLWMVNGYSYGAGRHDAAGHLGVVRGQHYSAVPAAKALQDLLKLAGFHLLDVNDLNIKLGDHPKIRILTALSMAQELAARA